MLKATQKNNIISISTPLGKDTLYLTHLTATEAISQLFSINVSMFTVGTQISLDSLVGKNVCITLRNAESDGAARYFHGVVSHLESAGMRTAASDVSQDYIDYQAVIVPRMALMKKRSNCRIFQNMSVIDIISDLFGQHKVAFQNKTTRTYPKYEYCVQYLESDLDFVCRLLQQEGIFFFFEHSVSAHTLVLADDITAYKPCAEEKVRCFSGHLAESHVAHWQGGMSMVSGGFMQKGYDYEQPKLYPSGSHANASLPDQSTLEVYDYLGESELNKRAQPFANNQLEALQKDMNKCSGQGDCRSFSVGKFFSFKDHENSSYKGKSFLITALRTSATQPNQSGAGQSASIGVYQNDFECVPKSTPYRPTLQINKPLINGVQTAVVTGESGDEQHIDKFGRVKVQFHWDRDGEFNSKSSCWIRVAQSWAGNKWGAFFFPRVGQEVLVEFINGDPDQPIISGAVYNADLMPPYALPAKKTQSGIKSHSTKEGGADNFNELRFDDEKGKELLFLQAEKDHQLNVKNDQKDTIGNDRFLDIVNNDSGKIGNDRTTEVVNNDTLKVGKDRSDDIGSNDTLKVGKALNIEAGKEVVIKTGSASIKMSSDGSISIEGTNIQIKGTNVKLNGTSIALKAAQIKLN
ncbi:type IV secretion protein Rhs [Shewanella sp. UCD-FRSSP16_17]|uniref:type VI secretion system Vgr family protein n=1 Tax=Shewanella sp. UCD-FRSSP16_17 TaxID=1853256 RepID=UPI0007EEC572|nr:type VI secretion system tip protein VgrG [Shewanella sp. UCD-FRSSP16_17]OBT11151.1 type IV secretion protein Rhs [Shewanella sp. UCD-FRSSP16_17]